MWRLVIAVGLWNTITSQPITDDVESTRQTRQLDFGECCPCPGSRAYLQGSGPIFNALGHAVSPDQIGRSSEAVGMFGEQSYITDDCPCRLRDADSEGSPSILFPRTSRPLRPNLRSETPKGEAKPLLHPEVGLASSVLETLRDATDEEYQEALARDAARNAARVSELRDAEPEAAKNIIIVVNPTDDAMPEASNAHETRYAHPLSVPRLGEVRESNQSRKFKLAPNFRNDMDSGASNVQENVVGINKGLEGLRLKTSPSVLKLLAAKKPAGDGNIQSLLKLRNKNNDLAKNTQDAWTGLDHSLKSKFPSLKFPALGNKKGIFDTKPLHLGANKLNITRFNLFETRKPKLGKSSDLDNNLSPSVIDEQVSAVPFVSNIPKYKLRTLQDITKDPLSLKNLFNLKDVELIPPKTNKQKIALPEFKLLPSLRINKPGTSFVKQRKKDCGNKGKLTKSAAQIIPKNQKVQTEILDVLPSQSQIKPVITTTDNHIEAGIVSAENIPKDKHVQTEILDALPSASEDHPVVATIPITESFANSDEDFLPENTVESATESVTKLLKDNIENIEESEGTEGEVDFINENDNGEFEEIEIEEENDQPTDIEITDEALDSENKNLSLEIFDGPEFNPEGISFNIGEINRIINEEETPEIEDINEDTDQENPLENDDSVNLDLFRQNDFTNQNSNEDAVFEPSNQVNLIESQDSLELSRSDSLPESNFQPNERTQQESLESKPFTKDNGFSSLRERVTLKLNSHNNPDTKVLTITRFTKPDVLEDSSVENGKSSLISDESTDVESLAEDTQQILVDEKSAESMNNAFEENTEQLGTDEINEGFPTNTKQSINVDGNGDETVGKSDMDSSATTNIDNIQATEDLESAEIKNNELQSRDNFNEDNGDIESVDAYCKACQSNLESERSITKEETGETVSNIDQKNEMASEASESVFNIAQQRTNDLRQNIVQPSSLFDGSNLFRPIPPLDLSNLNVNLPTFDDITSGISSLLGGSVREEQDIGLSSTELDSVDDCSDANPVMSTDASTTNSRSALPSLRPLKDIHLDIFQINPLTQSSPFTPKIPALNLNSFKTKLSLPNNSGLKPMKLQSSLGRKNGGLLGASLTFGPEKIGSSRHTKPENKLSSIMNRQGTDILGNPLANMPSFDQLRSTMRSNAESILNSPLAKQINEPIHDTLRVSQNLGNTLKTHTGNTVRNLQQSLASTMSEARMGDLNNVGSKFAKPQNVLEMVTSAHEDMNDKLHAIHTDIQDRLSSLHDRFIEQTNLPKLQSPLFRNLGNLGDNPLRTLNLRRDLKKTPTFPQSSLLNLPKGMKVAKNNNFGARKPITKTKVTISPPETRKIKEKNILKPYKMSKAASSLTPKTVEVPKLKTTSAKPPFLRPLGRDDSVKLKAIRPSLVAESRNQRPDARNQFKLFGDPSTTSQSASSRMRSQSSNRPTAVKSSSSPSRQFKSLGDSRGFASEPQPVHIPAPWTQSSNFESDENQMLRSSPVLPKPKPNPLTSSLQRVPKFKPSLSLPKTTESPLLAKMRDAIKIRLSTHHIPADKLKHKGPIKVHESEDMTKSASVNNELVVGAEPMKENVSYKCKMICVREP